MQIVIVDNERSEETRHLVAAARLGAGYEVEPRRGISYARNRILDVALATDADWIVMLDDDQTVPPDWLEAMLFAQMKTQADVVHSVVDFLLPDGSLFPQPKPSWKAGVEFTTTNGVMFRRALIAPEALGLRFDLRFGLSGGEDRFFFIQATQQGMMIALCPLVSATEKLHAERIGFRPQFRREFHQAMVDTRQDIILFGASRTCARLLRFYGRKVFQGLGSLIGGLVLWPVARDYARRKLAKVPKQLGRPLGGFWGLLSPRLPQHYLQVDGA